MQKPTVTVPDIDPPGQLEIVDDVVGEGAEASAGNTVSVHYVGSPGRPVRSSMPRGTGWSRSASGSAAAR